VIDRALRPRAEAALAPLARATPSWIPPGAVTALAVVPGLGAAVAAATGRPLLATALWLANRLLDGLDGTLARRTGRVSERGGYADILLDVVVYAAIPLGIAAGRGEESAWVAAAALLATFYVNGIAWAYLAALLERRGAGAAASGERTSVTMPAGVVEGTETLVLFALALAVPQWSVAIMWIMAAAVVAGVVQRAVTAGRALGREERDDADG
jgi:phosphatidylglycerophosphate synthase